MLYGLDLFSGIGGITLALERYVRPIAYCENDRYAQAVLISRMASGELPVAPIWDDITTLRAEHLPRGIDIIYGGFPCQDISIAGSRVGLAGERSGLIREVWRLADEIRPRFIFLENVPAIIANGLGDVLAALAQRGFDARWLCLSASDVGACHIRERWWLLAYGDGKRELQQSGTVSEIRRWTGNAYQANDTNTNGAGLEGRNSRSTLECTGQWDARASGASASNTERERLQIVEGWRPRGERQASTLASSIGWPTVAAVCGADDGIQHRVDRIKCLGNSVVPQCAQAAFEKLSGITEE